MLVSWVQVIDRYLTGSPDEMVILVDILACHSQEYVALSTRGEKNLTQFLVKASL